MYRPSILWGIAAGLAVSIAGLGASLVSASAREPGEALELTLRSRVESPGLGGSSRVVEKDASWDPKRTAIIVCDMWDLHHCLNAVRRVVEMSPRMDQLLASARKSGVVIIHAPSGCMDTYKDHPARKRAQAAPRSRSLPAGIEQWCRQIPSEEAGSYPIDQTKGGEDDDPAEHARWAAKLASMGRNPKAPWKSETDGLTIDEGADYISDKGEEIWGVLDDRGIDNVILMGVHLNMCVLGRPFGLRQMAKNGKNVALMRDLTDTMYDPNQAPYVSHFTGTDRMVEHVERLVCPTITSDQILGGKPFRFRGDTRPRVAFVISEDEYKTETTLPPFAASQLGKDFQVRLIFDRGDEKNDLPGLEQIDDADLLFVSARRRILPTSQVEALRRFVRSGKPIVGIRTASHAFAARPGTPIPEGHAVWNDFDPEVLGGHYVNHHKPGPETRIEKAPGASDHPILKGVDVASLVGHGSLYKVNPLADSATPILIGTIPETPSEPIAWTNLTASGGRVFYTSLGQVDDFAQPAFQRLLRNAITWAVGREIPDQAEAASTQPIPFPKS